VISNEFKLLVLEQIVEVLANGGTVAPDMLEGFREKASQVLMQKYPEMGIKLNFKSFS
jgi:hypothetical protein